MTFWTLQVVQLASTALLFGWVHRGLRRREQTFSRHPFLVVLCGYLLVCPISNLMRYSFLDRTALFVISLEDYREATLWWVASGWVAAAVYLRRMGRSAEPCSDAEQRVLLEASGWYSLAVVVLLLAFALNPFADKEFYVLNPQRLDQLVTGGLLLVPTLPQADPNY